MTVLSRMAKLAIASEPTPGVYQPPAFTVTFSKGASWHQQITPLRDRALRGSDSLEQDLEQGPVWSEWTIPSDGYPDLIGWYLRALVGPDTCTPGIATTLAAAAAQGSQSLSLAAEPAPGAVLMIGAGDTLEYAQATTPTGSGPYAVPLTTPLLNAHASGEAAVSQSLHSFAQNQEGPTFSWPRYSLTMDDGTGPLGWPGCVFGGLVITISKDGYVTLKATASGMPPAAQSTFTYDATAAQPMAGWQWGISQDSVTSTRGLEMALTLRRQLGIMPCINASQSPLGIWPGPLTADGSYTAIYEDQSDFEQFENNLQQPVTHSLSQPALTGGCSLSLTMPRSGWLDGEPDPDGDYLSAKFKLSGLAQPVSGPAFSAALTNYVQSAYT